MQKAVNVVADNFNTMRTGRANPAILDRIQVGAHNLEPACFVSRFMRVCHAFGAGGEAPRSLHPSFSSMSSPCTQDLLPSFTLPPTCNTHLNYTPYTPQQVEYYGAMTPLKQLASIAVPDASTLMISPFDKTSLKEIEKAINSSDIGINPNNDGQNIRLNIPPMTQVRICVYAVCVSGCVGVWSDGRGACVGVAVGRCGARGRELGVCRHTLSRPLFQASTLSSLPP